jgi:hypothetical protein
MEKKIGEWIYQEVPLPIFHLNIGMSTSQYNVTILVATSGISTVVQPPCEDPSPF